MALSIRCIVAEGQLAQLRDALGMLIGDAPLLPDIVLVVRRRARVGFAAQQVAVALVVGEDDDDVGRPLRVRGSWSRLTRRRFATGGPGQR